MSNIIVNGFNVGTELQSAILYNTDSGKSFPLEQIGHLRELDSTQQSTKVTITPVLYGGKRLHRNIYHDFAGQLLFDRMNGDITSLIVGIINRFQQDGYESYWSLYGKIFNSHQNSSDEYMWSRLVIDDHNFGKWNGSSGVEQGFAWRCQALIIQGAGANVLKSGPTASTSTTATVASVR